MVTHKIIITYIAIIITSVLAGVILFAAHPLAAKKNEDYYNTNFCAGAYGDREYRLDDGTRVDCITNTHAIEADWSKKWAEAIGQALYYSAKTGLQPGILLIHKEGERLQCQHYERLITTMEHWSLPIDVWELNGECKK